MRDFFRRIRIAWAVYKKDYEWLCDNALSLHRNLMDTYMNKHFTDDDEHDARLNAAYQIVDLKRPFIMLWKRPDHAFGGEDFFVTYCGTDEELKELKNQEIKID